MIVRLMGEGQWRIPDDALEQLDGLDNQAVAALEAGDEAGFRRLLEQLADAVRQQGERLDDSDLSSSDLIVPPSDLSLDEAHQLFSGDGLIPDLPV